MHSWLLFRQTVEIDLKDGIDLAPSAALPYELWYAGGALLVLERKAEWQQGCFCFGPTNHDGPRIGQVALRRRRTENDHATDPD